MSTSFGSVARAIVESGVVPDGSRVLCACSGGPDSVALLLGLDEIRRAGRIDLVVAHVHHGLRGDDADADLLHVERVAARLDVPFVHRRCDAAAERVRRRRGLEEAARLVRREALDDLRAETGCDLVALAHSADDQAETVLLWLVRGAGPDGLSGMPIRAGRIVRPLLAVPRRDLRDAVVAAGIAWRSDATNWAPSSARSLVRELLGRLEATFDARLVLRLCETAAILREESAFVESAVDEAARRLGPGAATGDDGSGLVVRMSAGDDLAALPPVVARRLIRRFLRAARPGQPPPTLDATRRVLALALDRTGACRAAHVSGAVIRRVGDELVSGPETPWRPPAAPLPLDVPGSVRWGPDGVVSARLLDASAAREGGEGARTALLDASSVAMPLVVRTRRRGETCDLPGGPHRLGRALAEIGVPAGLRDRHPLVCAGTGEATVVWVIGHAPSPAFRVTAATTRVLRLEWTPTRPSISPGEARSTS